MRWLLTLFVMLLVFAWAGAWLEKIGLGRLPGDVRLRLFGRELFIPFASATLMAVLISLILLLVGRLR